MRFIYAALLSAIVALTLGCAVPVASTSVGLLTGSRSEAIRPSGPSAGLTVNATVEPLAGCEQPNVIAVPSPSITSNVSRAQAERAAGLVGAEGPATIATLARVTAGSTIDLRIKPGTPEAKVPSISASAILTDLNGVPINGRAAWVLVFTNQSVPVPAGAWDPANPARPRNVTALAALIDAMTGEFIYGWGCALSYS